MFINSNKTTTIFVESFDFVIKAIIPSLFPFMIFYEKEKKFFILINIILKLIINYLYTIFLIIFLN